MEQNNVEDANASAPVHTGAHSDDDIIDFLKRQIEVKDHQIEALLERDRETNFLIQGLQGSLTGVVNAQPGARRDHEHGRIVDAEHQTPTRHANGGGDNDEHHFGNAV